MRSLGRSALHDALLDARQYTKSLVDDLSDAQWQVPVDPAINPVLWEVGHVAWFMERWCLRERGALRRRASAIDVDRLYDSAAVDHAMRWHLPLPSRRATMRYLDDVLDATLDGLEHTGESDAELYFFRLALYHEDMHSESFAHLRQLLGYPAPAGWRASPATVSDAGDEITLSGGDFEQGAPERADGFVFDNEKWAHPVSLPAFTIMRRPVSQAAFLAFVEDGGYQGDHLWSAAGRTWRDEVRASHPAYWRRTGAGWQQRVFDRWEPLRPAAAMAHVSAHEAEAFCRWAGRRLPTEAEWEYAAMAGAIEWGGSVWEWTATAFGPYPGFSADPYRAYSAPWFGTHRSVRGASSLTTRRLVHPRFRNFYEPHRNDVVIGFRTAADQGSAQAVLADHRRGLLGDHQRR